MNASDVPQHSPAYRTRRFFNWFPLGLTYALLYMGRYNLTVSQTALGDLMPKSDFGAIFGVGAWVYALAFLVNGPLTDKLGGKKAMLIGALGAALANLGMGLYLQHVLALPDPKTASLRLVFTLLYGVNMYFQSYGAVAIVKVNAHWFHVRERGTFSGIFGIMISTGLWLAFDVNERILRFAQSHGIPGVEATRWVFFGPALLLAAFFLLELFLLRDTPSQAGFQDFDTADASSGEEDQHQPPIFEVLKRVLTHKVILIIALVEFCTGVMRNGIMHWFKIFAKEHISPCAATLKDAVAACAGAPDCVAAAKTAAKTCSGGWGFMNDNWGMVLMVAGIVGGVFAGTVSDKFFQSRRAPAAGFLYAACFVATLFMIPFLQNGWVLGFIAFLMSICVIGTHGLLSGTATMDFGGRKAAGTAVGIIDGFVYLGTGLQSLALGYITSRDWRFWPVFLAPFALAGFYLLTRIWHAKPAPKGASAH
ncbi:MAG: MFS transporter [Elusimicrobiota bacterium]|jgi:OPA family glycerol-3-phosphate transporter-like MFS transporter